MRLALQRRRSDPTFTTATDYVTGARFF